MPPDLSIDGYTFDNPPNTFTKTVRPTNTNVPLQSKFTASVYQSSSISVQFVATGDLSLNESSDLSELQSLQQKAIEGGEVRVDFSPFFRGRGVLDNTPFVQQQQRSQYDLQVSINEVTTPRNQYPGHSTPITGNVFELGGYDFGYDPDRVRQTYSRETETVDSLDGLKTTIDNAGLAPTIELSGRTDGAGAEALTQAGLANELQYLQAEFQNGWVLPTEVEVANDDQAPGVYDGLYEYTCKFVLVRDPASGIGNVTRYIDHPTRDLGTYVAAPDTADADARTLDFNVRSGSVDMAGQTTTFGDSKVSLATSATNYIYVADPDADGDGQVRVNQSAFPRTDGRLYIIETGAETITSVQNVQGTSSSGGDITTNQIVFSVEAGKETANGNTWDRTVLDLVPSTTTTIYYDPLIDRVVQNTANASAIPLYDVTTDSNGVDVVQDLRPGYVVDGDSDIQTVNYTINGGSGAIDGDSVYWRDTTVELRYRRDTYIFAEDPDGDGVADITSNNTAVPAGALGLWKVETDGDGIVSETDLRQSLIDDSPQPLSDLSLSDQPGLFPIDLDLTPRIPLSDTVSDPSDPLSLTLLAAQFDANYTFEGSDRTAAYENA